MFRDNLSEFPQIFVLLTSDMAIVVQPKWSTNVFGQFPTTKLTFARDQLYWYINIMYNSNGMLNCTTNRPSLARPALHVRCWREQWHLTAYSQWFRSWAEPLPFWVNEQYGSITDISNSIVYLSDRTQSEYLCRTTVTLGGVWVRSGGTVPNFLRYFYKCTRNENGYISWS